MSIEVEDIIKYVDENIATFHDSKIQSIKKIKLSGLISRKNPYLFKADNILTSGEFVKKMLDSHLSSQEESMFGNFLEGLAKYVCAKVFNGIKSPAKGIDLDFSREGRRYLVSIRSGPNWGNSGQIDDMLAKFKTAKKIIGAEEIIFVNGCCYGRDLNENKGSYIKKCGEPFWEFISGRPSLYKEIIEPLGHKARERNEEFIEEYAKVINSFDEAFLRDFCKGDRSIDWEWIVEFNSAAIPKTRISQRLDNDNF